MSRSQSEGKLDRNYDVPVGIATALVVIVILLSLRPLAGIPRNDDFSYARTAESLAGNGRIAYNGWGSPLILPQAAIGALLIKSFGFSYSVLDLFGIICAGATAGVLFGLSVISGLSRRSSLFCVAVVVCNPMFLGTAPTSMTDIPSLLIVLLSFITLIGSLSSDPETEGFTLRKYGGPICQDSFGDYFKECSFLR